MNSRTMASATMLAALIATAAGIAVAASAAAGDPPAGRIDAQRLGALDGEPGQWFTTGRDGGKTHYSPLDGINAQNVERLGHAWSFETGTNRGMEATPVIVDGVLFASGVAGRVYALDAASGALRWRFEPRLDLRNARDACCDLVNRGVAVWRGKVYVGSFDGHLHALDARDGRVLWSVDTIEDRRLAYSVTGAPQVAGRVVVIGNGGAEFESRGYVSGYDLDSGRLVWRFHTVPGDLSKPQSNAALQKAAQTWRGANLGLGGGGNAWDAISYDPMLGLVYFGTANGAPWSRTLRDPANGDNLYLASIVALHAATGEYAWHYQQTPGDGWDFDATTPLVLATLPIEGRQRQVLMQASKNGFFYVLDRRTGELLAADPFVDVNWASRVDMKTGRPVENSALVDYRDGQPKLVFPSGMGAHNFNPMSFSARTGLVYVPTIHSGAVLTPLAPTDPRFSPRGNSGVQVAFGPMLLDRDALPPAMQALADPQFLASQPALQPSAALKAWDPVRREIRWSVPNLDFTDHAGVLSTGGGLVVQGGIDGVLRVYRDSDGKLLKQLALGTAMIAAPATYLVDGVQYIAILAGSGGGGWNVWAPPNIAAVKGNANRIIALRLDGGPVPQPPDLPPLARIPEPPAQTGTPEDVAAGAALFRTHCSRCHANASRSSVPDLRRSVAATHGAFREIVLRGALEPRGMPRWDDRLTEAEADQVHAYVVSVARAAWEAQEAGR
jgi:quinohemoprotein ethanol dehydrogenase